MRRAAMSFNKRRVLSTSAALRRARSGRPEPSVPPTLLQDELHDVGGRAETQHRLARRARRAELRAPGAGLGARMPTRNARACAVEMPCQRPRRVTAAPAEGPLSNNAETRSGASSACELLATPRPHGALFRERATPLALHLPQVYRAPPSVMAPQCSTPAETSAMRRCCSRCAGSGVGMLRSTRSPRPSWPRLLLPQTNARPLACVAMLW